MVDRNQLAKMIDHTLLRPDVTDDDIMKVCEEGLRYGFAAVCINPSYVALVSRRLKGSGVKTCTVVGFPLGATTPKVKAFEAVNYIENGAEELDMVINIGALRAGNRGLVMSDIEGVTSAAKRRDVTVKVIIEAGYLTESEKIAACEIAEKAGAHFVKTATGFGGTRATVEDVKLMKATVGERLGVKAAGGIRTRDFAERLIAAGATRLGTSTGTRLLEEASG